MCLWGLQEGRECLVGVSESEGRLVMGLLLRALCFQVGKYRIRMRCISGGYGRGIFRFTRMAKMGMLQLAREGWLKKYGYRPDLFR